VRLLLSVQTVLAKVRCEFAQLATVHRSRELHLRHRAPRSKRGI